MTAYHALTNTIEWGEPPPAISRSQTLFSTPIITTAALARPGEWGHIDIGPHAPVYAKRLRELGLDATARSTVVYFRSKSLTAEQTA